MDADTRVRALEERLERLEAVIERLAAYARLTPAGRAILKAAGL